MNARWPLWKVVAIAIAVTIGGGVLALSTKIPTSYSQFAGGANGAPLDVPPAPGVDDPVDYSTVFWGDYTRSMSVTAELQSDRSAIITETIVQVLDPDGHGIYRTIPTSDNVGDHTVTDLEVSTSAGTPDAISVSDVTDGIAVRIGDADTLISGAHTYRLRYRLENVVQVTGAVATVRLDAISEWAQSIVSLDYTVVGPSAPIATACYTGAFGAATPCPGALPTKTGALYSTGDDGLAPYTGFTVTADYPADGFATAAAVTDRSNSPVPAGVATGLMALGLVTAVGQSERRRRRAVTDAIAGIDQTFEGPMSIDLEGRRQSTDAPFPPPTATSALAVSAVPPLEFVPPVNLDPACLLRIHDGTAADIRKMVAATLVDLAADGVVGMAMEKKDWVFTRIPQAPRNVKPYELTLLTAILDDGDSATLSDRKSEIGDALPTYLNQVDQYLRELGLITADMPSKVSYSRTWRWPAFLIWPFVFLLLAGIPGVILATIGAQSVGLPVVGAVLGLAIIVYGWIVSTNDHRYFTPRGRGASYRARGFARFMHDSESIHARAAERMGLFREYMGYAVAFDAVTTWTKAMPAGQIDSAPFLAHPLALGSLAYNNVLTGSSRAAFAPAASSYGGSSFSFGGGGFSGGGSGGGGGGSW